MESLLQKITDAGIRTDETLTADITALPEYLGNFGFYHLIAADWERVLVKGVFKGNIRNIKGECPHEDRILNELAQNLADIERCLRHPAEVTLTYHEEHFYFTTVKKQEQPYLIRDGRNNDIPAPLTPVEASLGRNNSINDKHLFAKSPFASFIGETLSPFAYSMMESITDVLNPLFMSSNIKTHSPSLKMLYGRMYLNVTNIDTITSAFYAKPDFFYMNFLPAVYKGIEKPSVDVPNLSVLEVKDEEFAETLADINNFTENLTREDIFSDNFTETLALCFMAWEMAYLNMWKTFAEVFKLTKDVEQTMTHIYKTKENTKLAKEQTIMTSLDPAQKPVTFSWPEYKAVSTEDMFKTIPSAKRILMSKSKYIKLLADAHRAIDDMDSIYLACSALSLKIREEVLLLGEKMVENQMISDPKDIFYLEYSEIKNIADDSFFGNIPFTLNFRKWQNHRQSAMCLPAYLFEKDVENISDIVKTQMDKTLASRAIPCLSFFHKDMTTDNYICLGGFFLSDLKDIKGKDAVIAESASLFSYLARYCAQTDTPLYTGARYAAILTGSSPITFEKNNLKI